MATTLPAGRYSTGTKRHRSPRLTAALAVVAALVFGALIALLLYRSFGSSPISSESTGYQTLDDSSISVTFTVTRDDPAKPAVCVVRALTTDHSETGRREVFIPPSDTDIAQYDAVIRASEKPVVADVFGCGYDVPSYLLTP
ncbi:DUF4307 domain-containing protein [Rhodococcus sp. X156]|uniref:DUF4307 domain-containing protein n=1 Tax=Rhodococcus sp. X156 TaxID=2499145 RepID=UPI0013E3E021|nr:DUF4307 domain-containing protein [Rhodococcus sp. X156]